MSAIIEYIPYALLSILIGYSYGYLLYTVIDSQDKEPNPSKIYLVLVSIWEGIKNVLLFRRG